MTNDKLINELSENHESQINEIIKEYFDEKIKLIPERHLKKTKEEHEILIAILENLKNNYNFSLPRK